MLVGGVEHVGDILWPCSRFRDEGCLNGARITVGGGRRGVTAVKPSRSHFSRLKVQIMRLGEFLRRPCTISC